MANDDVGIILRRLDLQDHKLDRIEKKVDLTNGRVSSLEKDRDQRAGYEARLREERSVHARVLDRVVPAVVGTVLFVAGVLLAHYWPV